MDYYPYKELVKSKLEEYGSLCVLIQKESDIYDRETDSYETVENKFEGCAMLSTYDIRLVNGSSIEAGDVSLLCSLPKKPQISDVLEFGGKRYVVKFVNPCNIDGITDIFYEVQAK